MIIARLHRGGLAEAMATAKSFQTIDEMKQWFVESYENEFQCCDVVISDTAIYDSRNGWYTRYVCTRKYGTEIFAIPQCIGMCDLGELKQNNVVQQQ